jgi:uncharacterized membrane protein YphA (DoxX/SURF4 family)
MSKKGWSFSMSIENKLDSFHAKVKQIKLLQYFTVFNRIILAVSFIPSGMTKFLGIRFTQISTDTPIGLFFEGFYQTGFWYRFVGFAQILAAILLLIPRSSTLGATLFFPIVLNIVIITWSLNFIGTWVITTAMFLANLYLICWDYDKFKPIIPFDSGEKKVFNLKRAVPIILVWVIGSLVGFYAFSKINQSIANSGFIGGIIAVLSGCFFGYFNSTQTQKN